MKLKTRTNQPVYYKLPVSSNIQSLSDDLLNSLRVGDVVQKKTGNQKHCYIVTYKEEKKGICLTYTDCGYMETISYDYTGGHWVFNSKDVCEVASKSDLKIENIEDAQGHKRFVEGNGTIISDSGLSNSYCKWSLSGSHIMFVFAGKYADTSTIAQYVTLCVFNLPQWIIDKIYSVWGTSNLEAKNVIFTDENWATQNIDIDIYIDRPNRNIVFQSLNALTLSSDKGFRIQFDLLIDNESE